jgi:hypothetical protein
MASLASPASPSASPSSFPALHSLSTASPLTPQSNASVAPATSTAVNSLRDNHNALLSDLSILHGQFSKEEFSDHHPNKKAFIDAGYPSVYGLISIGDSIDHLLKKVTKREAVQVSKKDNKEGGDFNKQMKQEHKKLDELNGVYRKTLDDITALRATLETIGKGTQGVYDYEMDINYQVIGNQTIPPNYRRPKVTKTPKREINQQPLSAPPPKKIKLTNGGTAHVATNISISDSNASQVYEEKSSTTKSAISTVSTSNQEPKIDSIDVHKEKTTLRDENHQLNQEKISLSAEVEALRAEKLELEKDIIVLKSDKSEIEH